MKIEQRPRRQWLVLACLFFILGCFTLIQQTLLLREFFIIVCGNEISLGIVLASWLLGVFFGSLLGAARADRTQRTVGLLALALMAMVVLAPLLLVLVRLLHAINRTPPGTYIHFFRAMGYAALCTVPFSLLVGFSFPLAARLAGVGKNRPISIIYATEAAGALIGGLVYRFLLVEKANPFFVSALFGILLLASLGLLLGRKNSIGLRIGCLLLILGTIGSWICRGDLALDHWTRLKRWQGISNLTLIESRDSRFGNIQLGRSNNQVSTFYNGQFVKSFPDAAENQLLAVQLLCQQPRPQRILIIGEAVSGLAQQLLRYDVERVVTMELDRWVLRLIEAVLPDEDRKALKDSRLLSMATDGRSQVAEWGGRSPAAAGNKFDLVYINVGEPSTALLNRFYTSEFLDDLKNILQPGGTVAMQIGSSENYSAGVVGAYTASLYQTLKKAYPFLVLAPAQNLFFFASADPRSVSDDPAVLENRLASLSDGAAPLAGIFSSLYPAEKTAFLKKSLSDRRPIEINSDNRPISYYFFNEIFGWTSGVNLEGLLKVMVRLRIGHFLLATLVFLLWPVLTWKKRRQPGPVGVSGISIAVVVAGYAGLSFEVLVMFSFQNIFGYVFQELGLLIGLFMFGLSAGAGLTDWVAGRHTKVPPALTDWVAGRHTKVPPALTDWVAGRRTKVPPALANRAVPLHKVPPGGLTDWVAGSVKRTLFGLRCWMSVDLVLIGLTSVLFQPLISLARSQTGICRMTIGSAITWMGMLVGALFVMANRFHLQAGSAGGRTAGMINAADHLGAATGALLTAAVFIPLLGLTGTGQLIFIFAVAAVLRIWLGYKSFK